MFYKLFIFLHLSYVGRCDWRDEWMSPIQAQFRQESPSRRQEVSPRRHSMRRIFDESDLRMVQVKPDDDQTQSPIEIRQRAEPAKSTSLKTKLDETLDTAESLLEKVQMQINKISLREKTLKEAIANGRSGVTAVTVSSLANLPRSYLVRDGTWSLCNGMVQYPSIVQPKPISLFQEMFSEPRCIGQEVVTKPDPCSFNSIIKYETLPTRRKVEYVEDSYFCLKPAFNGTLEQYLSVPRSIINETCKEGTVRSYNENLKQCGVRVLSEYSFYPHRSSAASQLPLEYCFEKDGSCRMMIAWHVTNTSVENFEFLKNENNFKKYFIDSGPFVHHAM